ncbi:MAG TPA: acylphosphatase [Hyphomicrobiaceae bacterium]|nr:acylphosphatase [Hyphomicrobiaceae bacterium]
MVQVTRRIRVEGRVQGVGCRVFIEREAIRLGIKGFVRNRRDGSVEVLAHGETSSVDALVAHIRRGPRGGRIDFVHIEHDDTTTGDDFVVAPTV